MKLKKLKRSTKIFLKMNCKKKTPVNVVFTGVCFDMLLEKVELAGVEPASKHGSHMLSTCLFLLDFRDRPAAEQPNLPLFPVCFAIGSEKPSD